ncbi:uncharacterized [Lates japonicus]
MNILPDWNQLIFKKKHIMDESRLNHRQRLHLVTEKLSKLFNYITSKSQSRESQLYKLHSLTEQGLVTGVPSLFICCIVENGDALFIIHKRRRGRRGEGKVTPLPPPNTHTKQTQHHPNNLFLKCSLIK